MPLLPRIDFAISVKIRRCARINVTDRAVSEFEAGTDFGQDIGAEALDPAKVVERREGAAFEDANGLFPGKALHGGQFLNPRSIDRDAVCGTIRWRPCRRDGRGRLGNFRRGRFRAVMYSFVCLSLCCVFCSAGLLMRLITIQPSDSRLTPGAA